ncbi:MAG: type II toxin-antitoxin system HipA family toxin [Pseudomonadota bacterium]|nr:type II toxin-antitoxin system HipA family toxin [Pseudomonadota bacterium]
MSFVPVSLLHVSLRLGAAERAVGRLARVDRRILFEFDPGFLAAPLPLSPAHLPVAPGVHEEKRRVFDGLFGVFDDSLPDGWGRLLLDREMDRRGVGRHALTALDRLAFVGDHGAGALVYRPAWESVERPSAVDVMALAEEARLVLEGDSESVFPELLALGGSSGGARPKVLVAMRIADGAISVGRREPPEGYVPALVKFRNRADPADTGAIELAYARMAATAGIDMARTWLVGSTPAGPGFFATERFDRGPRVHLHSACGLLHADHRVPSLDYEGLLRAVRWLTRDQRAVEQMYRRMAFNVYAHNRDDHSRNFGFLLDHMGAWRLAPAYDLTFSGGPGGEHWMTVAGEGRAPGEAHLRTIAERVGIPSRGARAIVEEVRAAINDWKTVAAHAGVTPGTSNRVAATLSRLR